MKLGGCVVLYNPDDTILSNIKTYLPFVERLVAVDNSDVPCAVIKKLQAIEKIEVVPMGGNKGIATALNVGCSKLIQMGFDTALTMDQDSCFPLENYAQILDQVSGRLGEYAIVGLNFNSADKGDSSEIVITQYWLTSGNFVNLSAFCRVGGFNDKLFIDYVDIEYGHRLKLAGLKECYLKNFSLNHRIGNPIEFSIFGRTFHSMNHSPIRYYYRYRNSRYLYRTDRLFYRDKYLQELFINIPKMLLFEKDKRKKIRMISLGLSDGRIGNLGPFRGEII